MGCACIHVCLLATCSPTKEEYPSADSVFRVHGPAGNTADSAFKVYGSGPTADFYSKDWFIFDASLILPEYIIHFKYLSPVR